MCIFQMWYLYNVYNNITYSFQHKHIYWLLIQFFHVQSHLYLTKLTPWNRVLLVKLIVTQPVNKLRALWNPGVHYHVDKSPSLVPVLRYVNPVHTLTFFISALRVTWHAQLFLLYLIIIIAFGVEYKLWSFTS